MSKTRDGKVGVRPGSRTEQSDRKIAQQGNMKQHLFITLFECNERGLFENEKHFHMPATMHVQMCARTQAAVSDSECQYINRGRRDLKYIRSGSSAQVMLIKF